MNNRDLSSLLDYYRIKLSLYDKERLDWISRLEKLNIRMQDRRSLQLEINSKIDEIVKLKEEKKELENVINKEREKSFLLKEEVSYYKERSEKDRKRILQLLKLTSPVEQNVGLSYNSKPIITEKYHIDDYSFNDKEIDLNIMESRENIPKMDKNLNTGHSRCEFYNREKINDKNNIKKSERPHTIRSKSKELNNKQPIIRTVYVLGENSNINNLIINSPKSPSILSSTRENTSIKSEIFFLKDQIAKIKEFYTQLGFDKEQNYKETKENLKKEIEIIKERVNNYIEDNKHLEEMIYNTTKDLMIQRIEYSNNEKRLYEDLEIQKLSNEALSLELNEYMKKSKKELNKEISLCEEKYLNTVQLLKSQNKRNIENYSILMEQYKQIQKIYKDRFENLSCKISTSLKCDLNNRNKILGTKNILSSSMRLFNKK